MVGSECGDPQGPAPVAMLGMLRCNLTMLELAPQTLGVVWAHNSCGVSARTCWQTLGLCCDPAKWFKRLPAWSHRALADRDVGSMTNSELAALHDRWLDAMGVNDYDPYDPYLESMPTHRRALEELRSPSSSEPDYDNDPPVDLPSSPELPNIELWEGDLVHGRTGG